LASAFIDLRVGNANAFTASWLTLTRCSAPRFALPLRADAPTFAFGATFLAANAFFAVAFLAAAALDLEDAAICALAMMIRFLLWNVPDVGCGSPAKPV
jgi:hypothetical protein